jgi:hypothetical protein
METLFVVLIVALTTIVGFQTIKTKRPPIVRAAIGGLGTVFEWVGTFVLFLCANLALGAVAIFLIRGLTSQFVPLYDLKNFFLFLLSAVQASVFRQWWKRN